MKSLIFWLSCILIVSLGLTFFVSSRHSSSEEQSLSIPTNTIEKVIKGYRPVNVRPAAGAGGFYPADPTILYNKVEELIKKKSSVGIGNATVIHVPHAGYVYSGEVAAASFRELKRNFRRVFILAANHSSETNFEGVSIPSSSHYAIPGAEIAIDNIADTLLKNQLFVTIPKAHTMYMVEVQLPFLHRLKGQPKTPDFTIIPMILGQLNHNQIKQLAIILSSFADDETVFVFSVDLSHFYSAVQAKRLDSQTINAVMSRDRKSLARATTDGNHVLMTMVELADLLELDATHLDYRHSGMVSGNNDKVVGYAALVMHEPLRFDKEIKHQLLKLARRTISEHLSGQTYREPEQQLLKKHPIMEIPKGVFVTMKKNGKLRGCIGEIIYSGPLYKGLQRCAVKSAVSDPRFMPLKMDELENIDISISILEHPRQMLVNSPVEYPKQLSPHEDGVILKYKGRQSTFLPEVWEQIPDPVQFLANLCLKQGAPASCWMDSSTVLYSYRANKFGENK